MPKSRLHTDPRVPHPVAVGVAFAAAAAILGHDSGVLADELACDNGSPCEEPGNPPMVVLFSKVTPSETSSGCILLAPERGLGRAGFKFHFLKICSHRLPSKWPCPHLAGVADPDSQVAAQPIPAGTQTQTGVPAQHGLG